MKTGGTSFAFQLQRHFDSNEVYPSKGADRGDEADIAGYVSVSRLLRLSPERRAAIRVYTGHFPFVVSELLDLDLVTLTLLRDPVERTISVLKHFKRLSRRYHSHALDDIYEDPFVFADFIENHQTRMFSVTADDKPEAFGSNMSYWATASLLGLGKPPSDDDEARDEIDRERAVAAAESSIVDESRFKVAIETPREGRRDRLHRALRRVHRRVARTLRLVAGRPRHQGQGEPEPRGLGGVARSPGTHRRRQRLRRGVYRHARGSSSSAAANGPARGGPRAGRPVPRQEVRRQEFRREEFRRAAIGAGKPGAKKPVGAAIARTPGKADAGREFRKRVRDGIRAKHPPFFEALLADARITALYRWSGPTSAVAPTGCCRRSG